MNRQRASGRESTRCSIYLDFTRLVACKFSVKVASLLYAQRVAKFGPGSIFCCCYGNLRRESAYCVPNL